MNKLEFANLLSFMRNSVGIPLDCFELESMYVRLNFLLGYVKGLRDNEDYISQPKEYKVSVDLVENIIKQEMQECEITANVNEKGDYTFTGKNALKIALKSGLLQKIQHSHIPHLKLTLTKEEMEELKTWCEIESIIIKVANVEQGNYKGFKIS